MKNSQVIIKTYRGSQESATNKFRTDAYKLAMQGYYPSTQAWAEG